MTGSADRAFDARIATPFAVLEIRTSGGFVTGIEYLPGGTPEAAPKTELAREAARQIEAYVADSRFRFHLPLWLEGTDHQRKVWREIASIPPGATLTYAEIAKRIGSSARAVGAACGANPVPPVIPCHRVVAAQGIGGFMGGRGAAQLDIKRWLLAHEGV